MSKALILADLRELLTAPGKPSERLEQAKRDGRLAAYPELLKLEDTQQDPEWHPEGNVWVHTLMVVDEARALAAGEGLDAEATWRLTLGALLHDVGKPLVSVYSESKMDLGDFRWRAHGHEEAGEIPARAIMQRLGIADESTLTAVIGIVTEHMLPPRWYRELTEKGLMDQRTFEKSARRLGLKIGTEQVAVFLLACEADQRGRGTAEAIKGEFLFRQKFLDALATAPPPKPEPLLGGKELLALGFAPGPALGKLIQKIEEMRASGAISTKEDAQQFAASQRKQ